MKKLIPVLLTIGMIAGCSSTGKQTEGTQGAADSSGAPPASVTSEAQAAPEGTGTWHFSNQWWRSGIHYCEYSQGRNKVVNTMDSSQKCPDTISAP